MYKKNNELKRKEEQNKVNNNFSFFKKDEFKKILKESLRLI